MPTLHGRSFDAIGPRELGASPEVLISENYWETRFAGDSAILGQTIHLNGAAVTIVGVTPRDRRNQYSWPDFWLPLSLEPLAHGTTDGSATVKTSAADCLPVSLQA